MASSLLSSSSSSSSYFFLVCTTLTVFSFWLFHAAPAVTAVRSSRVLLVHTINNNDSTSNSTKNHHKWVGPTGHRQIAVDINGSGDFLSVQAAVNAVPANNTVDVLILISPGYYRSLLIIIITSQQCNK